MLFYVDKAATFVVIAVGACVSAAMLAWLLCLSTCQVMCALACTLYLYVCMLARIACLTDSLYACCHAWLRTSLLASYCACLINYKYCMTVISELYIILCLLVCMICMMCNVYVYSPSCIMLCSCIILWQHDCIYSSIYIMYILCVCQTFNREVRTTVTLLLVIIMRDIIYIQLTWCTYVWLCVCFFSYVHDRIGRIERTTAIRCIHYFSRWQQ